jgi:hypothetical protein
MEDPRHVEEMFKLFLARGVDINSRDQQTKGWTALHGVSIGDPAEKAAMLLRHGARVDLRDDDGRTPLDLARLAQQKHPTNPHIAETIRLLEEAQRKSHHKMYFSSSSCPPIPFSNGGSVQAFILHTSRR